MPRKVRDIKLDSRTARLKLRKRSSPYFVKLGKNLQMGYRRNDMAGTWLARLYNGDGTYKRQPLGVADDIADADGVALLDFWQAQEAAQAWAREERFIASGLGTSKPYAISDVVRDYFAARARRGSRGIESDQYQAEARILPSLGGKFVSELFARDIRQWHEALAIEPRRLRGKATAPPAEDDDDRRARRATANRVLTILKAALNHAFQDGRVQSDDAWRRVKPFKAVESAVVRFLTQEECRRLVNACNPAFRDLVRGALLSGCRYGELIRLQVSDFNPESGTLTVRHSKSGKPRHVVLTDEGIGFLTGLTAGRPPGELIFWRSDGQPWGKSHQQRPLIAASHIARIDPPATFHVLRHTHASHLAMQGVPLGVIAAQLGHADTRVTERHYAHLAPSYVSEAIRRGFPTMGITQEDKVLRLR